MNGYYDGLNWKLFNAIPKGANRVLELGCANGRLGKKYKEENQLTHWTGIEIDESAAKEAAVHLDSVLQADIDHLDLSKLGCKYDVIVIGDLLEHTKYPEKLLNQLFDSSNREATLLCCLPNMTHISVIQRMICGDMTYDEMGLLDKTHLRFYSQPSAFKLFLDSGWLPDLVDEYRVEASNDSLTFHLLKAAEALGVPKATAMRYLGSYQMIFKMRKWTIDLLNEKSKLTPFSVIVPVNKPWQYELNILKSPGLREIGTKIIPIHGAKNAAEAYQLGLQRSNTDWNLLVHQDVYFPSASGLLIAKKLAESDVNNSLMPIGFIGIGLDNNDQLRKAGVVLDRAHLSLNLPSEKAISIDEFAVALHKKSEIIPDASLGWHLWGTDLCLQALINENLLDISIVDVPLFHNSLNDYSLPNDFYTSVNALKKKYPNVKKIPTLCGLIEN